MGASETGDIGDAIAWDEGGLAPALVQDANTGEVLMVGWMNREALSRTRETGWVHFYSRSRRALWRKGETSGNTLEALEVRTDCDADAILVRAERAGPTCHRGVRSCFHRSLASAGGARADENAPSAPAGRAPGAPARAESAPLATAGPGEDEGPGGAPASILDRIYAALETRRDAPPGKSYTASLLSEGVPGIVSKIAEEQTELAEELPRGDRARIVHETADLLFHVWVGLVAKGIPPGEVWRELESRFGVSGHDEKAARAERT